jgi:hypothetical protein
MTCSQRARPDSAIIGYLQGLSPRTATPLAPWTFRVSVSTSIDEPENQKIVDLQELRSG